MIGRMIRAFGADDVATRTPAKFRKLRFLMIANNSREMTLFCLPKVTQHHL